MRSYSESTTKGRGTRATSGLYHHDRAIIESNQELTEKEIEFIEIYFTNGHDVKGAAKGVGLHASSGPAIYRRPWVLKAIYERMTFEKLAAPEVVGRVGKIARADIRNYMRVEEEDVNEIHPETGFITVKTNKRVVVDLVQAMENDDTYPLKSVEFYRTGEVKKITVEDKLAALQLVGNVYGLFGKKEAGDDSRPWFDRARDLGIDPRTALEEMQKIALEWKVTLPKEIVDGQFSENIEQKGDTEITFAEESEE